ncbi:MAG TPA: PfkB family carbohydrate kinase [bacterium]|nr:PfkB family carbohydrate kinase [bacterium]
MSEMPSPPERLLAKIAGREVLVVGDPCLDEYRYGPVGAIAREAPVACLDERERVFAPGQATNVAVNAAALGGRVTVVGVLGDDSAGERLSGLLRERGVTFAGVISPDRPTTDRLKLVATEPDAQHVFHSYHEQRSPLDRDTAGRLLEAVRERLPRSDAVVVSDYSNGAVFPEMIALVRESGRPWAGDTRNPLENLAGATCLKPNAREVRLWGSTVGSEGSDWGALCDRCRRELGLLWLCLTLGDDGLELYHDGGVEKTTALCPRHLVRDHTGAGDTVTAALGLALAAGLTPAETTALASWAAADVVAQTGTSVPRVFHR